MIQFRDFQNGILSSFMKKGFMLMDKINNVCSSRVSGRMTDEDGMNKEYVEAEGL